MTQPRRYTFVTVAFEGDLRLMDLQARSMALYCDAGLVDQLLVVDNFAPGAKPPNWEDLVRALYGSLEAAVSFIAAADVADSGVAGWVGQQALKLAIARHVRADRYVLLDAKNHLLKPLSREFLEAPDGRPRINGYPYDLSHPLYDHLQRTCAYVGIDAAEASSHFVRTSTPFTMLTAAVVALVDQAEREHAPIAQVLRRWAITEFFLYAATLAKVGVLRELYAWDQPFTADVWAWGAQDTALVRDALQRAMRPTHGPFFSLHRAAVARLDADARMLVAQAWRDRGLVADVHEGLEVLGLQAAIADA
jgi:hypothetical protein